MKRKRKVIIKPIKVYSTIGAIKYVIKRTYSMIDGEVTNKICYVRYPVDAIGQESETIYKEDAFVFTDNNEYPATDYKGTNGVDINIDGGRGLGNCYWKQEFVSVL